MNNAPHEIVPITQPYYDRMDTELAIAAAREMIDEWSYADDPHGYCHVRPVFVRLVEAVTAAGRVGG